MIASAALAHGAAVERSVERELSWLESGVLLGVRVSRIATEGLGDRPGAAPVRRHLGGGGSPRRGALRDSSRTLALANARGVKNLPGRKKDVNDAHWLADLLAHGLVRPSFMAPQPIQELRDLTRTRRHLVRERAQHVQRVQMTLENANLKLTGTLSDVVGESGRAILDALVAGETDPAKLASLAVGKARKKNPDL